MSDVYDADAVAVVSDSSIISKLDSSFIKLVIINVYYVSAGSFSTVHRD